MSVQITTNAIWFVMSSPTDGTPLVYCHGDTVQEAFTEFMNLLNKSIGCLTTNDANDIISSNIDKKQKVDDSYGFDMQFPKLFGDNKKL